MNRAQSVLKNLEETVEKTALVHPDHVEALHKRLKEKKVPHHKHTKPTYFGGIPYVGFGVRPEYWGGFMGCCDDVGHGSATPVTVSSAQTMGGAGGATASSVGSSEGNGGGETGP